MTEREVIKRLKQAGWIITQGTRHYKAHNEAGIMITIPRHKGKDLTDKTLASIARVTGVKMK